PRSGSIPGRPACASSWRNSTSTRAATRRRASSCSPSWPSARRPTGRAGRSRKCRGPARCSNRSATRSDPRPKEDRDMRMSVCVMADIDEIGFYPHVESLGYDSAWVADSQMLFSDCYAVLALAARQTSRLRLGPGVAICGTRIPPVHVAAMATLNRLAPGRVHLGIGTGNTALRSMGQAPMRIADYARYLEVLRGLLRGDVVDYVHGGTRQPIKMLIREKKYMSLEPRIPLYVSAFGPRAMEVGGQYGDGLVIAIPPRGLPPAAALERARVGARRDGRELGRDFHLAALTNVVLLEPGEAANSERVIRAVGPNV